MSTRYVWAKYSSEKRWSETLRTKCYPIPYSPASGTSEWFSGYLGSGVTFEDGAGSHSTSKAPVSLNNPQRLTSQTFVDISYSNNYYAPYNSGNTSFAVAQSSLIGAYQWYVQGNFETGSGWALTCVSKDTPGTYANINYVSLETVRGSYIENVSDSSMNKYPTTSDGGISGDYWYVYRGSDNIDPTAISYQTAQIRPGDVLTVSVEPRANTYGGTISYLYQYSTNGGSSWVTIQTTTATSINFTVPAAAKSIQFRVRAQDDMGFTSTTYVTGAAVVLERLNLWVGVNSKARKGVELYVGVNGKARKVTAAYIGVAGKARRFL